jgi:hypothetical protein
LDTAHSGAKFGQVQFTTNDPDAASFEFNISGNVTGSTGNTPVLTLPGPALSYIATAPPRVLDPFASVSDPDSPNFAGGSLAVDPAGNWTADDRLAIRHQGSSAGQIGVTGAAVTYGGATIGSITSGNGDTNASLVMSLNANATLSAVQALLRNITYSDVSDSPSTLRRYVRFTLTDNTANLSNQPVKTVSFDTYPKPKVNVASFAYDTAPHAITFQFSTNVSPSLSPADLTVVNRAGGAALTTTLAGYDGTDTARFTFPSLPGGLLPDGSYRATLAAAGVNDSAGAPLALDQVVDFFVLTGDANHDRTVDTVDFNTLAANFSNSEKTFAQGDFNYDGTVDTVDFNLLAANFSKVLAAPSTLAASPVGAVARGASAPTTENVPLKQSLVEALLED